MKAGRLAAPRTGLPQIEIGAARAVATCLKPADDPRAGGIFLRVWETAGQEGPLRIGVRGFAKAIATDLLERDQAALTIGNGAVEVNLKPHGYAALRLVR